MVLSIFPKKFLGIDIGTSTIKIVELQKFAGRIKLENYGEISVSSLYKESFRTFEKNVLLLSTEDIARAMRAVIEEAKIRTKKSILAIPDFSTFFTNFELPPMTQEELSQAVEAEARRHVPVPLGEVVLDWQLIEEKTAFQKPQKLKILLVAVPNEVINQYRAIVSMLKLDFIALEAEVFGLLRSLIEKNEERTIGLIDVGARSTTCSIIDKKVLKSSYSFDVSGSSFTEKIARGLSLDDETAEEFKKDYGILPSSQTGLGGNTGAELLTPLIDSIIIESENIFKKFYLETGKDIAKIILAGGSALMPGLLERFQTHFKKEVEIGNPFKNIFYPPILEETLKKMGPSYAIAVGMALRGIEE